MVSRGNTCTCVEEGEGRGGGGEGGGEGGERGGVSSRCICTRT